MKPIKKTLKSLTAAALLAGLAMNFNACSEQSPLQSDIQNSEVSLNKPGAGAYPQYAERTLTFHKGSGTYAGGNVKVNGGSTFHLEERALTPPPGAEGEPVTITMLVEKDKFRTELTFTFGPSGASFDPPAEVTFNWKDLHSSNATLYYIDDNGDYIPQTPDYVDIQNKKMTLYIDHFSRYAIGAE